MLYCAWAGGRCKCVWVVTELALGMCLVVTLAAAAEAGADNDVLLIITPVMTGMSTVLLCPRQTVLPCSAAQQLTHCKSQPPSTQLRLHPAC
jgi:hypothetical protein